MMWLVLALCVTADAAQAQVSSEALPPLVTESPNTDLLAPVPEESTGPDIIQPRTIAGETAVLRGLDKMTGHVVQLEIPVGEMQAWERLEILPDACHATTPEEKPDAYAWLTIRDIRNTKPSFDGWMVASSPALSAMDHPRYDVWVVICKTSEAEASAGSADQ